MKAVGPAATPRTAPTLADLQARLGKADSLLVEGKNREAVALLLEVVGAHPDSPGAWDLLTLGLIRMGEPRAAVAAGNRALLLEPASATIRFNLGLAYFKSDDLGPAIPHLQEAARLNQVRPEPLLYLGLAQASMMRANEAKLILQELEARFPKEPEVRLLRTQLALSQSDLDEDGKREVVTRNTRQLSVANGATGELYLKLAIDGTATATSFGLLGSEGERFFAAVDPKGFPGLFHLEGKQLEQVKIPTAGRIYFLRDTRELKVEIIDRGAGTVTTVTYAWQGGALVEVGRKLLPTDGSRPNVLLPPVKESLDLFLAALYWRANAYASEALLQEVRARDKEKDGPWTFLLPAPDGGYRLELWTGDRPVAKARAVVGKELKVEQLVWE